MNFNNANPNQSTTHDGSCRHERLMTIRPDFIIPDPASLEAEGEHERLLTGQITQALGLLLSTYTDRDMHAAIDRVVTKAKQVRQRLLQGEGNVAV